MRIRFKPWARPELEASKFYRDNPEELKGKWIQEFKNKENPIHLELGCGKGQFISQIAFQNPEINYIAIDLVDAMLGLAKRTVEQTYNEAEIYFKTDDDDLFRASLGYFEEAGFEIINKTYDLHSEPILENNIETEHEKMFSEQGIKIKALIAKIKN